MPAYLIVPSLGQTGETVEASICDLNLAGFPDRKTDLPVKVERISERMLRVDGVVRGIISSEQDNGVITYLVDGSAKALRNHDRRAALVRVAGLLQQLRTVLIPLVADSVEPAVAVAALQDLISWLKDEREAATGSPAPPGGSP